MVSGFVALIIFIFALGGMIFVHEFGHFIAARWAKIEVEEFGFGLPSYKIATLFTWQGTEFTLHALPFGGFVRPKGENDPNMIEATPRPGHTVEELQKIIDEEIATLQREGPTAHEVQRAINQTESSFFSRMERVGGYSGKADQLNAYYTTTGDPDWFNEDLARYRAISPSDVRSAADTFLPADRRVELIVVPEK